MKLRVSPSLLEQYRVVQLGLYNKTAKDLINYMTGDFVVNDAISRGSAYHQLLEFGGESFLADNGNFVVYEKELNKNWVFTEEAASPALQLHNEYTNMLHEVWVDYNTTVLGHDVKMRMKVDGLDGLHIHEFKTTSRKPKIFSYRDSLQWRCYLLGLPESESVTYSIFQIGTRNNWTKLTQFNFERDSQSESIVQKHLSGFIDWVIRQDSPGLIDRITMKEDRNPLTGI